MTLSADHNPDEATCVDHYARIEAVRIGTELRGHMDLCIAAAERNDIAHTIIEKKLSKLSWFLIGMGVAIIGSLLGILWTLVSAQIFVGPGVM